MIQLLDSNINGDHLCCTVGKWVCSINTKTSLKNRKTKFDVICSYERNSEDKIRFVEVASAVIFTPSKTNPVRFKILSNYYNINEIK